jgi:hypothetical protein
MRLWRGSWVVAGQGHRPPIFDWVFMVLVCRLDKRVSVSFDMREIVKEGVGQLRSYPYLNF